MYRKTLFMCDANGTDVNALGEKMYVCSGLFPPEEFVVGPADTTLKSINISDFEAATQFRGRAAEDVPRLD